MAKSRLHELSELGQSVWIDVLSRKLIESGELERMLRDDAVKGVTSNPTIFEKAISEGNAYDEQLRACLEELDDPKEIFYRLAVEDIQDACQILRPVWDETGHYDGYVSMEVDPTLAYDTEGTIDEATRLHEWIDRPNLFVKIPATQPGLPAIEEMISRGRSINVTLTFSLQRHREVNEAYFRGLERLVEAGGDPAPVASVASFFVSRVDTETDKRLEAIGSEQALALRGKLAIANAKLAYQSYKQLFSGERWQRLEAEGANKQRCLWASTSTKNPEYRDVLYERVGVDYDDVTRTLEEEGVQKFSDSFSSLLDSIRAKQGELASA
jgi:transaldolase